MTNFNFKIFVRLNYSQPSIIRNTIIRKIFNSYELFAARLKNIQYIMHLIARKT